MGRPEWPCAGRPSEALHLRLSEPGSIEPAAGDGVSSQHRGPLAVGGFETGLQDHRRISGATIARRFAPCSPVRIAVLDASTCTAASCWRSTEPASRRSTTRIATSPALRCESSSAAPTSGWKTTPQAARRGRCRGRRDRRRRTYEEPGRKDCGAQREARPLPSDAGPGLRPWTASDQISLTDPDSRAMAAHTKVGVGYNIQVAVDAKNKLIVEQAVTNQVVDLGLLTQTAEPAREVLGVETIDVVADRGYFKIEDIEACEKTGCVPHIPKPQRAPSGAARACFARTSSDRRRARRLRLPGREVADADPPRPDARSRKDRLRQPESLPRLSSAPAMHERRPLSFPPRKRGRSRSHGRAPQSEAGDSRPPPRGRRAPVRQHQAVDVSGRLPDARPRQRARRVQPDRARL